MPKRRIGFVLTHPVEDYFPKWKDSLKYEHFLDVFARGMIRRGHTAVKYIPAPAATSVDSALHAVGHTVRHVPTATGIIRGPLASRSRTQAIGFTQNLIRELDRDQIDVVYYANYYTSYFVPAFAVARTRPVLAEFAGGFLPRNPVRRLFWRTVMRPSMRATSGFLLERWPRELRALTKAHQVGPERMFDFPIYPVDERAFRPRDQAEARRELNWPATTIELVALTRVPEMGSPALDGHQTDKDPFRLVRQFATAVREHMLDARLHVLGWGPGLADLRAEVNRAGIQDRCQVHGFVPHDELGSYLAASDALYMPWEYPERLDEGLAAIEAFLCERPVIGWRRYPTQSRSQLGGFLIDADSAAGGQELAKILVDRPELERKGREARQTYATRNSVGAVAARLEDIIEHVIRTRGAPAQHRWMFDGGALADPTG